MLNQYELDVTSYWFEYVGGFVEEKGFGLEVLKVEIMPD